MLINLSNHSSEKWENHQKRTAITKYNNIEDLTFPNVDPNLTTESVNELAVEYLKLCIDKMKPFKKMLNAIHISGEQCFVFHFVTLAKAQGISCVCSTTKRFVENEGNMKTSIFQFVQFRNY